MKRSSEESNFVRVESLERRTMLSFGAIDPGFANVNVSRLPASQGEAAITVNPRDPSEVFALSNNAGTGLMAAQSSDGGKSWTSRAIANGSDALPLARSDPATQFDAFGNLFVAYLYLPAGAIPSQAAIEVLMSTDQGSSFISIKEVRGDVDRPSLAVGPSSLWVAWTQGEQATGVGAAVNGFGSISTFGPVETISPEGVNFAGIMGMAVANSGQVVVAIQDADHLQGPSNLFVATNVGGLSPGHSWQMTRAATTQVGALYVIPAQSRRAIDAEAAVAVDNSTGPHAGRIYFAYTDTPAAGSADTNIFLQFSDNSGATWSGPMRVNDDHTDRSQFFSRVAVDPVTGLVALSWYDCRNSATNDAVQLYAAIGTPTTSGIDIGDSVRISQGSSSTASDLRDLNQFNDFNGLEFFNSTLLPTWADNSNSTGDNPDGTSRLDINTAAIHVSTRAGPPTDPAGPSLTASLVRTPTRSLIGGNVAGMVFRISNQGPGTYAGFIDLRFLLSRDGTVAGASAVLGDVRRFARLRKGASTTLLANGFILPTDLPDDDYFVVAQVDPGQAIAMSTGRTTPAVSTSGFALRHPIVDLEAHGLLGVRESLRAGRRFTVAAVVGNPSNANFSGPITIQLFDSPGDNPAPDNDVIVSQTTRVLRIPRGSARFIPFAISLPAGFHRVGIRVLSSADADASNDRFLSPLLAAR